MLRGIRPVIDSLLASGATSRFFFLRYWQGGPQVRLRVLAPTDLPLGPPAGIEERIEEGIESFLSEEPGEPAIDTSGLYDEMERDVARRRQEDTVAIVTGNCVRRVPYEPEYEKYGGPQGVKVAEELFHRSSEIVLDTISEIDGSARRRMGIGWVMSFSALRAAGLRGPEIADFFAYYCRLWSPWAVDDRELRWKRGLEEHRAQLIRQASAMLSGKAASEQTERWEAAVGHAWSSVRLHADDVLPHVDFIGRDTSREHRQRALLASYIHTHNNRLGIIPGGEAYLAYLGHHAVSAACELAPQSLDVMETQREGGATA
jgi:thiopeptide-type bacteriocin biosynthesis protein